MLGELALGQSDISVVRTWLKTMIESAVHNPRLSSFAPFQEYFVNQQPFEEQLANMFAGEFSTPIEGTDEPHLTTFRLALANHLEAPLPFIMRVDGRAVLSDVYRDLFVLLATADTLLAIDTATNIVRDTRLASMPFASSQQLALFLFQTLDAQLAAKAAGSDFYEAVFRCALSAPESVASAVPEILESYILALGNNDEMLFRLFCDCQELELAYLVYLANHYPRLLVKRETRFKDKIKTALPHGFPAYLEAQNNARFARVRGSVLIANLNIDRSEPIKREAASDMERGYEIAALTGRPPSIEVPKDLNQAAAAFEKRAGVPA